MPVIPPLTLDGPSELDVQRELTRRFIAADPTIIALTPTTRTKQATGSYKLVNQTPRAAQTFKMIPMTAGQKPTVILNGVERIADYTLLGTYDALVAVDDWFMIGPARYTVVALADGHGYETKALVEGHG